MCVVCAASGSQLLLSLVIMLFCACISVLTRTDINTGAHTHTRTHKPKALSNRSSRRRRRIEGRCESGRKSASWPRPSVLVARTVVMGPSCGAQNMGQRWCRQCVDRRASQMLATHQRTFVRVAAVQCAHTKPPLRAHLARAHTQTH